MVGDNGPALDGWHPQPGKHCGSICLDLTCPTCGEWVNTPPNVILGSE